MVDANDEKALCKKADSSLPEAKRTSIIKQIGALAVKFGQGAGSLAKKLAGIKSADEALAEITGQIDETRRRREPLSGRFEELYREIVAKKKVYLTAPGARKKILEMELKSAIAEYQSLERQISAYLKNETVLVKVKGRMCELVAMNLKSVTEDQIDILTDRIESAADESEDIAGAVAEMDKAGVRREHEDASFEDALDSFGDDLPETPAADGTVPDPLRETPSGTNPVSDF